MSNDGSLQELQGEELRCLISASCDDRISAAEFERLVAALRSSREARTAYIAYMSIHANIHGEVAAKEYLQSVVPSLCESASWMSAPMVEDTPVLQKKPFTTANKLGLMLAVAGCLALVMFLALSRERLETIDQQVEHELQTSSVALAHVVTAADGCEWSLDHASDAPRGDIRQGDMIRVSRGKLRLAYVNGVELTVHSPALFEVISDMRGRVLLGRITAKIAKGAEGFSVLTPRATVVDLGTELGIEVDDAGATDVVVFDGSVDLNYTAQESRESKQRRLFTGEALRLDAYGTISRIVSISNRRFSDELSAAQKQTRPAIITAVRDNIQRNSTWNYYEIVHAGMQEDARAFVDRQSHEWNGIDTSGMPKFLLGGDYVKTFNNDKCRTEIEIVVVLDAPCKLYVLFDQRSPPPQWLSKNFRDTGKTIGVDGGPWVYNGVASKGFAADVGPGKSIDDVMSIWERVIGEPGPVRLGATETAHDDLNMYGIVAVPLETAQSAGR